MTLTEISKDLRALSSLASDLADQVDRVSEGLVEAFKGVGLGIAAEIKAVAQTPRRLVTDIHNSMASRGVPRKTSRRLTKEEKDSIRAEYNSLALGERTKSARESIAKKYHCTARQVSGLVLPHNLTGLALARQAKAANQIRSQVN